MLHGDDHESLLVSYGPERLCIISSIIVFGKIIGHVFLGRLQEVALDVIHIALPQGRHFAGVLNEGGDGECSQIMGGLNYGFYHGLAL